MCEIKLEKRGWECQRCSYKWIPRKRDKKPKVCPKCHSAWWDEERKNVVG